MSDGTAYSLKTDRSSTGQCESNVKCGPSTFISLDLALPTLVFRSASHILGAYAILTTPPYIQLPCTATFHPHAALASAVPATFLTLARVPAHIRAPSTRNFCAV